MNAVLAILFIVAIAKVVLIAGALSLAWRAYRRSLPQGYGFAWRQGAVRIGIAVISLFALYNALIFERGGLSFNAVLLTFAAPVLLVTIVLALLFTVATLLARRFSSTAGTA